MSMTQLDLGLLVLAVLLGLLMSRTSLCTVAGVQQCLRERNWNGMRPMLVATCGAGLVLLAAHWAAPASVALPPARHIGVTLALGGLLLGLGALINGACYLGSVQYLSRGNANFVLTVLGLGIAARLSASVPPSALVGVATRSPVPGLVACLVCLGIALAPLLGRRAHVVIGRRATWLAALGVGLCAGAIYALHPAWSYGALIDSAASGMHAMVTAVSSAALLLAGATVGALLQHRWSWVSPHWLRALRCLAGGIVMGFGAHLIPGGNDMLLLWSIPGLALYGVIAYAIMVVAVAVLMLAARRPRPLTTTPGQ